MNTELKNLIIDGLKKAKDTVSQNQFAEQLGISEGQMSNVMNYKYDAVSERMWAQLLKAIGGVRLPKIETQNYRDIQALCKDAQERHRLVACAADTGLGKTTALRAYKAQNANTFYMLCASSMSAREFSQAIASAVGLVGQGFSANKSITRAAAELNTLDSPLFIFDDCGKLGAKSWPLIQELRDRTEDNVGIVIAGMPYLRKYILQGVSGGWNGFAEIYRRIGYWQSLRKPAIEEVEMMCTYAGITNTRTIVFISKWATNFGLLNELLENALRAMAVGNDINDVNIIRALQVGDAHLG